MHGASGLTQNASGLDIDLSVVHVHDGQQGKSEDDMQLVVAGTYSKETHEGRGAVPGGALVLLGSNNDGRGLKEEGIPIKGKRPM